MARANPIVSSAEQHERVPQDVSSTGVVQKAYNVVVETANEVYKFTKRAIRDRPSKGKTVGPPNKESIRRGPALDLTPKAKVPNESIASQPTGGTVPPAPGTALHAPGAKPGPLPAPAASNKKS